MERASLITAPSDTLAPANGLAYRRSLESAGVRLNPADDPGAGALVEYSRLLQRRKGALILITFLGLLASILLTLPQTPVYQARTVLEIQNLNENFLNIKQLTPVSEGDGYPALTDIQTQLKLLQSDSLLKRVIEKLKSTNPGGATGPASGASLGPGILQFVNSRIDVWRKALKIPEPKVSKDSDSQQAARSLKVRVAGQTRIIELLYDSTDPGYAAAFANTLAQEFIDSSMEARWKMSQYTSDWLSNQLEDMRIKLERSEDALQSYAQRAGLMFTSEGPSLEKTNISEDKLRQLQEELSKAQGDRIAKQAQWETTQTASTEALPDVLNDSSLRAMQDKITELRRQRAELITTYTEKHSKVQRVEAQITPLEAALEKERAAIVARLRNDYETALRSEKLLANDYANQSRLVADQAEKSIQYNILKREVDSNRQLYETMLQRVKESTIASAMRASNVRIVDLAEPPVRPYKPSMPINSVLGLICGLLGGVAFVILRERADCSLHSPADVRFWLNVRELGVIPSAARELRSRRRDQGSRRPKPLPRNSMISLAQALAEADRQNGDHLVGSFSSNGDGHKAADCVELISWQRKPSLVAESFRGLLTSILFSGDNDMRPNALVVTSANPTEGKTTVTCNLGIAFAEINRKVLVIDGDLRKPRLHSVFGVSNERGLTTLLKCGSVDSESLASVVLETSVPGLFLLPSGLAHPNEASLLYGAKLPDLLARLRGEFDMVLIDTPPMLQIPDARVLGTLVDAVILVMRAGHTNREAAMAASQRLSEDGTRVLGTILNGWDPKQAPSGVYGDAKAYGYFQ
jgi:polysaccharide biosynthesis transport protein